MISLPKLVTHKTRTALKAVLFDMDGVLLQSEHIWIRAKSHVLRKHNIPHARLLSLHTIGLRLSEVVDYWYTHESEFMRRKLAKNMLIHEITQSVEHFYEQLAEPSENLESALQTLKAHKITLGIASVSPLNLITAFLKKNSLAHYFDRIISGESIQNSKPHPEIYLKLAEQFAFAPAECVAVEDSVNGLRSVQAAKMKSILYWPFSVDPDERGSLAHLTMRSFKNFPIHLFL